MFSIKEIPIKVISLKTVMGEDIICGLLLSKGDLPHGIFRKSKIVDPHTGKESISVIMPVKTLNQLDLNNNRINAILVIWNPCTGTKVQTISYDMIASITSPSEEILRRYVEFFQKSICGGTGQEDSEECEPPFKIMTPTPSEIQ